MHLLCCLADDNWNLATICLIFMSWVLPPLFQLQANPRSTRPAATARPCAEYEPPL